MSEQACFICKKTLRGRYAALPTCNHRFHLSCLMKWSSEKTKNQNQRQTCHCPITSCGRNFESIRILETDGNNVKHLTYIRNLICLKCKSVFKPPILMIGCCGRCYCLNCIAPQLQHRFKCPLDRNFLSSIRALTWVQESIITLEIVYRPGMVIVEQIGRALSSNFVCRICTLIENIDDIFYCFCCSSCYHYKCDQKENLKERELIRICSACIRGSRKAKEINGNIL
ncbi:unnamed protein product [Hymenolepis diminuta]|uniref:RING-type domain-containing protein n=1 Tax=Hymenolepis diminuta TaxID=6216 RepID=A0A0R3SKE9_HYMDI|nr:unnamed protein product [Hymenolepis diminuta]VUZ56153.1 unnamed protein product [Hymenolepis diminuta]